MTERSANGTDEAGGGAADATGAAATLPLAQRLRPAAAIPPATEGAPVNDNVRAVGYMLACMAVWNLSDAMMKLAVSTMPAGQAMFLRGAMASSWMTAIAWQQGTLEGLARTFRAPFVKSRTVAELGAVVLFFVPLAYVALPDATALLQFVPLCITAGSALFLGEQVGWRRWTATAVGLAGVIMIVKPGSPSFNIWTLLILSSVFSVAARDLLTRKLDRSLPLAHIMVIAMLASVPASLCFMPFESWRMPEAWALAAILVSSLCTVCGQYFSIVALRTGELSVVAPFRYSGVLFSITLGWLIWRDLPDWQTLAGVAIVIAAGVYTFRRELKARRGSGVASDRRLMRGGRTWS